MKTEEAASNAATPAVELTQTKPSKIHRSAQYQKVLDGGKQPIRNLRVRNGSFSARTTAEDSFVQGEDTTTGHDVGALLDMTRRWRELPHHWGYQYRLCNFQLPGPG